MFSCENVFKDYLFAFKCGKKHPTLVSVIPGKKKTKNEISHPGRKKITSHDRLGIIDM